MRNVGAMLLAAANVHSGSMLPLKIFFALCLVAVLVGSVRVFRKRKQLFGHDPHVPTDNWASRNLRTWQVALVLLLTIELLIMMLLRL
jgi:hypothetical protein